MNRRQLEYFLAVARELNFTRAAESLFVSQTAVTQQIRVLEEQLGVQLFVRTKRKVEMTPAGKVFQREALGIMNRMDAAVLRTREASSGFVGSLNIGFTIGIGNTEISDRIQMFNRKYPNIVMRFKNLSPSVLLRQLREGELDLALMPMFQEKYYAGICCRRVVSDHYVAILPKNHVLAQNQFLTWKDLKEEPLFLAATPDSEIGEDLDIIESFIQNGLQPNVLDHIEDMETIMFMISANLGITILPAYMAIPAASRGKIVTIPIGMSKDQVDIIAAWMPEEENPSLEKILPFLEEKPV
ncbi:MAG: LysR family transcriptional regulator [Lachnospiraceae bacterium]|nr:LysR family transcriptional regulator [Lachnospiraceae bacterium]